MYTLPWMKFNKRWRRLLFRLNTKSYSVFIGSTVMCLAGVRSFATSAGPADTHSNRMAADGTYKNRKFAEVNDSPLYRLPEQPQGGHRLDGKTSWAAKAKHYEHH